MPNTTKRSMNMDILRCLALFFVLAIHFCTHCNIYNAGYTGFAAFFTDMLRNSYTMCLGLFVMLTGYFQYKKTLSGSYYLGILKLYEMYVLCSVLNLLYTRFYVGQAMSLREMASAIVNYGASEYSWYVLLYNGLFLFIPFLNLSYNNISCRGHKRVLILTLFFISALPFSFLNAFVNLNSYWWQRIWPVMFYFIGAYFAEYKPRVRAWKAALVFFGALVVFSAYNYFLYSPGALLYGRAPGNFRFTYESLQNAVMTPVFFLWIMNINMEKWPEKLGKLAATVSKYSYGAFLFSSITDSFVYIWLCRFVPEIQMRYLFFPIVLPISYVAAVLLAVVGDRIIKLADRLIRPVAKALVNWLYRISAPDAPDVAK